MAHYLVVFRLKGCYAQSENPNDVDKATSRRFGSEVKFVPIFDEKDVESFFLLFEKIAY